MKKFIVLILMLSLLSASFSGVGAWFVDKNGNNITTINFDYKLYGYVDLNPNGYVYICFPFNLTGIPITLLWTDQNYNFSSGYEIAVGPVNISTMQKVGNYYCSKTDVDISPLKAIYPGKPVLFGYKGSWARITPWYPPLLNGSYYAYIANNPFNISIELSRVMNSKGEIIDQYLNKTLGLEKVYRPTIVLNLVNLSSGKAIQTKLVTTLSTVYFTRPHDFDLSTYGSKYMFYANGLPVHNLNCTTCEGKPDGTPCSFNVFPEDRYGCVTQPGETHNGICAGGYCHPTCDPSLNYYNKTFQQWKNTFNDYCFSTTDGLQWYSCCPNGNQYHICVYNVTSDCPAFCGELNIPCCPQTPTQPLCNEGQCVCLIPYGTECVNNFIPGQMLKIWNINDFLNGNILDFFYLNSSGTYSCCGPNSGCSIIFPTPNLPHLCRVIIT